MCSFFFKSLNLLFLTLASIFLLSLLPVYSASAQAVSSCSSSLSASNIRITPINYTPNPAFKFRVAVTLTNTSSSIVKARIFTYSGGKLTDNSGVAQLAPKQSTELSALFKDCSSSLQLRVTSSTTIGGATSTSSCSSYVPVKSPYCCSSCATPASTGTLR